MDTTMNQRISLQQHLDRRTEAIVNAADAVLSEERMKLLLMDSNKWQKDGKSQYDKKNPMKAAQFSNFLGAAKASSNSPAAIRNWILYQMGRDETQANWGKTNLGKAIIMNIDTMAEWAKKIADDVYEEATEEQILHIHVTLIAKFAGYLRRWFIAKGGSE